MASVLTSLASLNSRVSTLENASAPPVLLLVNSSAVAPNDASVIPDAILGKLVRLETADPDNVSLDLAPSDVTTAGVVFTFVNTNALGGLNIQINNGIAQVVEIAPRETIRLVYVGGETGWVPF